jgi:hypothetical protein
MISPPSFSIFSCIRPVSRARLLCAANAGRVGRRQVFELLAVLLLGHGFGIEEHADLEVFYRNKFFHLPYLKY